MFWEGHLDFGIELVMDWIVSPPNVDVEVLTLKMTEFRDKARREGIKVYEIIEWDFNPLGLVSL